MAVRWRNGGRGKILCAAKSKAHKRDVYIDDNMHYFFAVVLNILKCTDEGDGSEVWEWDTNRIKGSKFPHKELYGSVR